MSSRLQRFEREKFERVSRAPRSGWCPLTTRSSPAPALAGDDARASASSRRFQRRQTLSSPERLGVCASPRLAPSRAAAHRYSDTTISQAVAAGRVPHPRPDVSSSRGPASSTLRHCSSASSSADYLDPDRALPVARKDVAGGNLATSFHVRTPLQPQFRGSVVCSRTSTSRRTARPLLTQLLTVRSTERRPSSSPTSPPGEDPRAARIVARVSPAQRPVVSERIRPRRPQQPVAFGCAHALDAQKGTLTRSKRKCDAAKLIRSPPHARLPLGIAGTGMGSFAGSCASGHESPLRREVTAMSAKLRSGDRGSRSRRAGDLVSGLRKRPAKEPSRCTMPSR